MPHVLIIHEVEAYPAWKMIFDQARRFFESPELVEIRKNAGVKAPDFFYLHEIEHGLL